ncbi:AI-2E family transporter [Terribacillus saccharophilus]|uniref:Predicted PurR-regulated permease PerM n=2 Tax=Terribacillus saccharophilus TaxID=361277 RepID=A0AAX2ECE7_9BACI|nr:MULTISPECIES: AI-2E family transporter [Terribacillus]MCM3224829.1 AI-2E family transporter [Terribacillus saccharophilus]SEM69782.1 Predicted PurR-regulated permease PerM [Terribacillus saccharophilus]
MLQKRWFQSLTAAVLILTIILLLGKVNYIFTPLYEFVKAIAFPLIAAGFLFYITRPLVKLLERLKLPRWSAILILFLLIIGIGYLGFRFIAPIAQDQIAALSEQVPVIVEHAESLVENVEDNYSAVPDQINSAVQNFSNNLENYTEQALSYLTSFLSGLVSFTVGLILIPFFLFFMLKDGDKLKPFLTKFFTGHKSESLKELLRKLDHTLSSFIQGQFIVSCCVGALLYIGYLIIGLEYSLIFALIGLLLNFIPFLGPYLAAAPAVLVAFFQDPMLAVWAAVVMFIAQQIESSFISPNVMGKVLKLHPLTVISLLLAAGNIAGFIGLLLIVPIYAAFRTAVTHFYGEWRKYHFGRKIQETN